MVSYIFQNFFFLGGGNSLSECHKFVRKLEISMIKGKHFRFKPQHFWHCKVRNFEEKNRQISESQKKKQFAEM